MNSFEKKQQEEKLILKYFIEEYNEFPKGKLIKSESPDFILKTSPKRSIGIELTRLFNPGLYDQEFLPELDKEIIINCINEKEKKLRIYYKKKINKFWLIMIADLFSRSTSFNINNSICSWTFESRFNKIFLFELFNRRLYELK
jgi:hypothetical protein